MALFSFGKKDKPPEDPATAKGPATMPKVQPVPGAVSSQVKAPQPAGLIPAPPGIGTGSATTQPMVMPRGSAGLKAIRVGASQSNRSTQRIILPPTTGARPGSVTAAIPTASGRINLPVGMILRCLPAEILTADISQFEANGSAATEVGLPMNLILSQLPSGKVELTLEELITHLPAGFLQPTENLSAYLANIVSLPLMDVVMRIPPDLLALRPDQKEVDAAVINMADPFTEEILREQAEAARAAAANGEPNIIEESQVPVTEEFVPQAEAVRAPIAAQPSLSRAQPAKPAAVSRPSAPPMPGAIPPGPGAPAAPNSANRTVSPSARMPAPNRATAPIVHRPGNVAPAAIPSVPLAPRPPAPPAARPIASPLAPANAPAASVFQSPLPPAPAVVRRPPPAPPAALPIAPISVTPEPEPEPEEQVATASEPAEVPESASEAPNDELARLAALAMAEMGEEEALPAETPEPNEAENTALPETEAEDSSEPFTVETTAPPTPAPVARPPTPTPSFRTPAAVAPAPTPRPMAAPPVPVPSLRPPAAAAFTPAPILKNAAPAPAPVASAMALNLNTCAEKDLRQIPGIDAALAGAIIQHREKSGPFRRLEDLLQVPGLSKAAYQSLTGEEAPMGLGSMSVNEILGFPTDQKITLKDVTDRIMCWPDVTGCVLSQVSGLPLVGSVPTPFEKGAIVAFAPRIFETVNKSFAEIAGRDAEEIIFPTAGTSFHFMRKNDFYLIILCRLPQLPDRHLKVARFVLDGLNLR